jgi:hypothetical protein
VGLATIVCSLRFENFPFVASYGSRGHGGGIRTRFGAGNIENTVSNRTSIFARGSLPSNGRCIVCFDVVA